MEFTDLQINADYRQIGGAARAKYDKNAGNIADADRLGNGGGVPNTPNGIIMPDIMIDFTIPENPVF